LAASFGRYLDLRRKKAARASEVRPARATSCAAHSALRSPQRQQKQSINHAGKETNALRRTSTSKFVAAAASRLRAFAPPPRAPIFTAATDTGRRDPASC
jgi:hypothetical protein